MDCILEPVCLEQFIFSTCPHPGLACRCHHYELLADAKGMREYGVAGWKGIREADPFILVQMIEEVRSSESVSAP